MLIDLIGSDDATTCAGIPSFWSDQYESKILSVGLPHLADTARVVEGDPDSDQFVVAYGCRGRLIGAAGIGSARSLARYRRAIFRREELPDEPVLPPTRTARATP